MECQHCGVQLLAEAAFCHACGRTVAASASDNQKELPEPLPTFQGLRLTNWFIVALLVPGTLLVMLRSSGPTAVIFVATLMAALIATFLLSALMLFPQTTIFAGLPIFAYQASLRKLALACNVVVGVFGFIGVIACVVTGQFGPMLAMLLYAIPSILNFRALRFLARRSGT